LRENVKKTEVVDFQQLPKWSFFHPFRTKIQSTPKKRPFLALKNRNYLDK